MFLPLLFSLCCTSNHIRFPCSALYLSGRWPRWSLTCFSVIFFIVEDHFHLGGAPLTQDVNTPSQDCSSSPLTTRLVQLHPEEEVSRRRSVCRQQIGVNGSTKQQTLTQQTRDCLNRFFLIHDHSSSLTPATWLLLYPWQQVPSNLDKAVISTY